MGKKRMEIHALQLSICALMFALDRTFFGKVPEWKPLIRGFDVDIKAHSSFEVAVEIHPVEWPEGSVVHCGMNFDGKKWDAYKGTLRAQHISGLEEVHFYGPNVPHLSRVKCRSDIEGNPVLERVFGKK